MHRLRARAIVAALVIAGSPPAVAQQGKSVATGTSGFYLFGGGALFDLEKNNQLQGERSDLENFMFGGGYKLASGLAIELGALYSYRGLDTPPAHTPAAGTYVPGTLQSEMTTFGIGLTLKQYFSTDGPFTPYIGGGVGVYETRFLTTSDSPNCTGPGSCMGSGPRTVEHYRGIGYNAQVGADYAFTRKHVGGMEIRYFKFDAAFPSIPGELDLGGTYYWIGYRYFFRP